jgi:putative membrane protein
MSMQRDPARDERLMDSGAAAEKRPANPNATRDHLANERTLLAWVRTCIAIIGLGFVVARFGLLVRELGGRLLSHLPAGTSTVAGTALVICGAILAVLAARQYLRTIHSIERNDYRPSPALGITLTIGIILVAALLAVYLILAE